MIHVKDGMLSVEGNALQLLGESTAIIKSVIEYMPHDSEDEREMSGYLLRGMVFAIEKAIADHGFDTHASDEERKLFAESDEEAEKAVEEDDTPPRELLNALLKALGAVDVTDDFMSDDDDAEHTDVFRDIFGDDEGVIDDLDF